jgi:hypothetical protein
VNRLAVLDEKPAVVRYERERPSELIHLDIKKLGRIAGMGHASSDAGLVRSIAAHWLGSAVRASAPSGS